MSLSTEGSDISHRGACSWESALFKGPDDFNGCGYFHVILLLIALRGLRHSLYAQGAFWLSLGSNMTAICSNTTVYVGVTIFALCFLSAC